MFDVGLGMTKLVLQPSQSEWARTTDIKNDIPYCIEFPSRWQTFWENQSYGERSLSYDFIYILPQPMTQLSGIQFRNCGSAYVSIYGAPHNHYQSWLNIHHNKDNKDHTKVHSTDSNTTTTTTTSAAKTKTTSMGIADKWCKQSKQVEDWCLLWPDTQLLPPSANLKPLTPETPSFSRTWTWTCNRSQQYRNHSQGPFYAICVRCRPFYDIKPTTTTQPKVGLYCIQLYGSSSTKG